MSHPWAANANREPISRHSPKISPKPCPKILGTISGHISGHSLTGFPGSGHTDFQNSGHTVPANFWGTSEGHFWGQLATLSGTCFEDVCRPSLEPLFESACLPTSLQWNDWGSGSETSRGESHHSPGSGQPADNQTPRSENGRSILAWPVK